MWRRRGGRKKRREGERWVGKGNEKKKGKEKGGKEGGRKGEDGGREGGGHVTVNTWLEWNGKVDV